jgi:hypothetical protein
LEGVDAYTLIKALVLFENLRDCCRSSAAQLQRRDIRVDEFGLQEGPEKEKNCRMIVHTERGTFVRI